MKKELKFLIFLSLMINLSCSKPNVEESKKDSIEILGKWKLISATKNGVANNLSDCNLKSFLDFKNNYSFESLNSSFTNNDCVDEFNTGNYSFQNLEINLENSIQTETISYKLKIVSIDSQFLIFKKFFRKYIKNGIITDSFIDENNQLTVTYKKQ